MKGAPEVILARSAKIALDNKETDNNEEIMELINNAVENMANTGMR